MRARLDSMIKVVLGSGSPRRLELLRQLGLEPVVIEPDIDETRHRGERPHDYVLRVAAAKSRAVSGTTDSLIVAADTIVVLGNDVLGKPTDAQDASAMLSLLSGCVHQVVTGVAVRLGDSIKSTTVSTGVEFVRIDTTDIRWYVATGEPMDKAGAYAIQGHGGSFIRRITGSSSNVIGLPLVETADLFAQLGHPVSSLRG